MTIFDAAGRLPSKRYDVRNLEKALAGHRSQPSWACAVLTLGLLPACVPLPLAFQYRPEVVGVVRRNSEPIDGTRIWWAAKPESSDCSRRIFETQADASGAFTLEGEMGFPMLAPLLPFHCIREYRICVATPEMQPVSLLVHRFYGSCAPGGPPRFEVRCDLELEEPSQCALYTDPAA